MARGSLFASTSSIALVVAAAEVRNEPSEGIERVLDRITCGMQRLSDEMARFHHMAQRLLEGQA